MARKKVAFPKYLNAKSLFYRWEFDLVLVSAASGAVTFFFLMLIGLPLVVSFLIAIGLSIWMVKKYIIFFKKARNGFVSHWLYSKGITYPQYKDTEKKEFEKNLIPYGFEDEFIS